MKPYVRAERVGVRIQTVLSDLLRKDVQDPRLEMATISSVRVSSDLRVARIYFSVFGGNNRVEKAAKGFKSSHGFIKKQLAAQLGLRYMPELKFIHDTSFDRGARIDLLLKSIAKDK